MMNNPKVLHKAYGEGVVTGINGDYISVQFSDSETYITVVHYPCSHLYHQSLC